MASSPSPPPTSGSNQGIGIGLLIIGIAFLLLRLLNLDWIMLWLLAVVTTVVGMIRHEAEWFLPAGLCFGLGLGIFLLTEPFTLSYNERGGALFLLSISLGWILMAFFSRRFSERTLWWTLLPALIMWLFANEMIPLLTPPNAGFFRGLNYLWPVVLIVTGAYFIVQGQRRHQRQERPPS